MAADRQPKTEKKSQGQQMKESAKKQEAQKEERTEQKKKFAHHEEEREESLIRISGYDIPGSKNLYAGLTRVKGVGWAISNAVCLKLGFPKDKKVGDLSKDDIKKIEEFLSKLEVKDYMKNRRNDEETGETSHLVGTNLDMRKDFDIRKMKKIRSYKGVRHTSGQPVRGQRTRSHFRKKGQAVKRTGGKSK